MWNNEMPTSPNVLIVQSDNGDVFIVEDVKSKSAVDKINSKEKSPKVATRSPRKRPAEPEVVPENEEDEEVIEEYLDECFEEQPSSYIMPPSEVPEAYNEEDIIVKEEVYAEDYIFQFPQEPILEAMRDHQYMIAPTVDGTVSSNDSENDEKPTTSKKMKKHKIRQLTGKPACKYCDTIFKSKDSFKMHVCVYLQCDPKNFICRICNKELSRKTFSNHLHETLDCQYCNKKFINPRNLKTHIERTHNNEEFVPPRSPDPQLFEGVGCQDESIDPIILDESTGLMMKTPRKKYPRKKGRFECDLCGRLFTSVRSLKNHMDLHTNSHKFVCDTCGERYATYTGISKHACLNKKRRRPEVDFRTFDVRHCKFCGLSFECLEDTRAHECEFQFPEDPKMFRCRFCMVYMSKNSYNKHMARHLSADKEWICSFCNKKLSDQIGLNIHMTTHTGDKPFKCPHDNCQQSFINKQLLTRHTRFHGVEITTHVCDVCNKEVASKYHLKTHMKLHSDVVECQLCDDKFTNKETLKEHYQESHEPYPCSYCEKVFILPRYLKMHEKLHNPTEKTFKCDYCLTSKSYSKMALLMNHVFKVHNERFDEWKQIDHPGIFKSEPLDNQIIVS